MSRYTVVIVDQAGYRALSGPTRRLFDADMPKLARDPRHPPGLRASTSGRDTWLATVADGEVIIQYRIIDKTVQVRINSVRGL